MTLLSPTNFPSGDRRTIRVALPPVPVALVLVDCDGDVWRQAGATADGEPRLVCDSPQDPDDRGDGPSFAWTRRLVEAAFGPVRVIGGAA